MKDISILTLSHPADLAPPPAGPEMSAVKSGAKSPTCKVCGDESSGFHYGVDSCEGCKGFFRRCITQGMTHKCSNEEKCEITPFTRNSCQYCRLKKCFSVGMSREASRLGRRPKRLRDSTESKAPSGSQPIAPYPSPSELHKLRMAELHRLLQQNGTFKSDLMQAFLSAAQASFREHQRNPINESEKQNMSNKDKKTGENESGYSSLSSPSSTKSQSPQTDLNNMDSTSAADLQNQQDMMMMQQCVNNNLDIAMDVKNSLIVNGASFIINQNMFLAPFENSQNMNMIQVKQEPGTEAGTSSCQMAASFDMDTAINAGSMPEDIDIAAVVDNATNIVDDISLSPPPEQQQQQPHQQQILSPSNSSMTSDSPGASADVNDNDIDVERFFEDARQVPTEMRMNLIGQVTETVLEAHMESCRPTHANVKEANERLQVKVAQGLLPDLSKLFIDPNSMWQQFLKNMVPEITLAVKFCKRIPGFIEITQADQINLIKQGSFEILLCRFCNLVDCEKEEMFDSDMIMKCPRSVIKTMPMGCFVDEFFRVAGMFNPLGLTDGEIGLFSSVLIICPDRTELKNKKAIQKLQSLLLQCLYLEIQKNHRDADNTFKRLISLIPVFRQVNAQHAIALNNMKMNSGMKFPPLHAEVFDIGDDKD